MTFKELITEAIKPRKVDYGTNYGADNLRLYTFGNTRVTIFQDGQYFILVYFSEEDKEFGFSTCKKNKLNFSTINTDVINYFLQAERTNSNSATAVFSKVFYVILEMKRVLKIKEFYFSGEDEKLNSLYIKIINGKSTKEELRKLQLQAIIFDDKIQIKEQE